MLSLLLNRFGCEATKTTKWQEVWKRSARWCWHQVPVRRTTTKGQGYCIDCKEDCCSPDNRRLGYYDKIKYKSHLLRMLTCWFISDIQLNFLCSTYQDCMLWILIVASCYPWFILQINKILFARALFTCTLLITVWNY